MARLRTSAQYTPCVKFIYDISAGFKIIFHNVRSLVLHKGDIDHDLNYTSASLCIFVETNLSQKHRDEDFSIPGFSLHRNDNADSANTKPSYGTVVYTKLDVVQQFICMNWNIQNVEVTCSLTNEPVQNLHIIGLYRSPSKVSFRDLLSALQKLCCKSIKG